MPSTRVYSVSFANGNLIPAINLLNWPNMRPGGSNLNPASAMPQRPDPEGLILEVFRGGRVTGEASNSVYVMPDNLPVESRLLMEVSFDLPEASGTFDDKHPWAVDLKVKKLATTIDTNVDAAVSVTCQFRTADGRSGIGERLNTPFMVQSDNARTATNLQSLSDYSAYQGTEFLLQSLFCGVGAVQIGYAVGCGFLNVKPADGSDLLSDARVFSHVSLWPQNVVIGRSPSIGALGVSVITQTGEGTIRVRLRSFAVHLWRHPPGGESA